MTGYHDDNKRLAFPARVSNIAIWVWTLGGRIGR
jgi:hypothetical protein